MSSYNHVVLIGRLGRDPEVRYTQSGKAVANFSMATSDGFGEKKTTNWHNIVAWGKTAELCKEYLHKGSLVCVDGRLQNRSWEDKDGNKRSTVEVVANSVTFMDPKGKNGGKKSENDEGDETPQTEDDLF